MKWKQQIIQGILEQMDFFQESSFNCVSFLEDGSMFALGVSNELLLYDTVSGKIVNRIKTTLEPKTILLMKTRQIAVYGCNNKNAADCDICIYSAEGEAETIHLSRMQFPMVREIDFVYGFTESGDGTLSGVCRTGERLTDQDVNGSEFYENDYYKVTWETGSGNILSAKALPRYDVERVYGGERLPREHFDGKSFICRDHSGLFCIKGRGLGLTDAELAALRSLSTETGAQQEEALPLPVGGKIRWDYDMEFEANRDWAFITMYEDAFGEQYDPLVMPQIPEVSLYFAHERKPLYTLYLPELYPFTYRNEIFTSTAFSSDDKTFTLITKATSYTFELSSGRCLEMCVREDAH